MLLRDKSIWIYSIKTQRESHTRTSAYSSLSSTLCILHSSLASVFLPPALSSWWYNNNDIPCIYTNIQHYLYKHLQCQTVHKITTLFTLSMVSTCLLGKYFLGFFTHATDETTTTVQNLCHHICKPHINSFCQNQSTDNDKLVRQWHVIKPVRKRVVFPFHRDLCSRADPHRVGVVLVQCHYRLAADRHSLFPCPCRPSKHTREYHTSLTIHSHVHTMYKKHINTQYYFKT